MLPVFRVCFADAFYQSQTSGPHSDLVDTRLPRPVLMGGHDSHIALAPSDEINRVQRRVDFLPAVMIARPDNALPKPIEGRPLTACTIGQVGEDEGKRP